MTCKAVTAFGLFLFLTASAASADPAFTATPWQPAFQGIALCDLSSDSPRRNRGHAVRIDLQADGSLARGTLRSIFALDAAANEELKRILRPAVLALAGDWTRRQQAPYVVWESALAMDQALPAARVLAVDATDQKRAGRIALRNPDWTADQVASIIAMQLPRAGYLARADDVVHNDGTLDDARALTLQLHHRYTDLWS